MHARGAVYNHARAERHASLHTLVKKTTPDTSPWFESYWGGAFMHHPPCIPTPRPRVPAPPSPLCGCMTGLTLREGCGRTIWIHRESETTSHGVYLYHDQVADRLQQIVQQSIGWIGGERQHAAPAF